MPVDLGVAAPKPPEIETPTKPNDAANVVAETVAVVKEIEQDAVRAILRSLGATGSMYLADDDVPKQWRFTDDELDDIVPGLTRIINRRPALQKAVERGDELAVGLALMNYGGRNYEAGRKAAKARKESDGQPGQDQTTARPATAPSGATVGTGSPNVGGGSPVHPAAN